MKTKTPNEEIQYLGQMLTATTEVDTTRLLSIANRVAEIANATKSETTKASQSPLFRWWLRTRPTTHGIQRNQDGTTPCVEFYVPWWAWPLELSHRLFFGTFKLNSIYS